MTLKKHVADYFLIRQYLSKDSIMATDKRCMLRIFNQSKVRSVALELAKMKKAESILFHKKVSTCPVWAWDNTGKVWVLEEVKGQELYRTEKADGSVELSMVFYFFDLERNKEILEEIWHLEDSRRDDAEYWQRQKEKNQCEEVRKEQGGNSNVISGK